MHVKPITSWRENNQNQIKSKGKKGEAGLFPRHFFHLTQRQKLCVTSILRLSKKNQNVFSHCQAERSYRCLEILYKSIYSTPVDHQEISGFVIFCVSINRGVKILPPTWIADMHLMKIYVLFHPRYFYNKACHISHDIGKDLLIILGRFLF